MVSIIIPVYNSEKHLSRCIESVLCQSDSNFEVLLINDGSWDNSGKICEQFALNDFRIRVFHKTNGGASSARNVGLENAVGDFICFIDSDDIVPLNYLEAMLLNEGEDLSICTISYNTDTEYKLPLRNISGNVYDMKRDLNYLLLHMAVCSPCCKMFRRSIIANSNLRFDENVSSGEDMLFVYDYFAAGLKKLKTVSSTVYEYNVLPFSLSHQIVPFDTSLYIIDKIVEKTKAIEKTYFCDCSDVKNELLCTQINNILKYIKLEVSFVKRFGFYRILLSYPPLKELLLEKEYILTRKGQESVFKRLLIMCGLSFYSLFYQN